VAVVFQTARFDSTPKSATPLLFIPLATGRLQSAWLIDIIDRFFQLTKRNNVWRS